jgi:hypothetical protein
MDFGYASANSGEIPAPQQRNAIALTKKSGRCRREISKIKAPSR